MNDTFPILPMRPDPARYLASARQRAAHAVQSLGWSGWHPPTSSAAFNDLFPFIVDPRPLQIEAIALCPALSTAQPL